MRLAALRPIPPAPFADALMLHLDVCSTMDRPQGGYTLPEQPHAERIQNRQKIGMQSTAPDTQSAIECAAATWAALAALLRSSAQQALQASDNAQSQGDDDSSEQTGQHMDQSGEDASSQCASSSSDWAALQPVLQTRAWWWGAHTLKPACIDRLTSSGAHETVAAMALAAAFMQTSNAGTFCQRAITALQAAEAQEVCQQLEEGMELCRALIERQANREVPQEPDTVSRKKRRRNNSPPSK